jgi:primosomal protein N' (replication factor Y)
MVRVPLHGRRVRGWVVAAGGEPPPGVTLKPIAGVRGAGPPAEVVDLARWGAWRWAGRPAHLLRTASPDRVVARQSATAQRAVQRVPVTGTAGTAPDGSVFAGGGAVVRMAPASDPFELVLEAARCGDALVLVPSPARARRLAARLAEAGIERVAVLPDQWASAGTGVAIGTRTAAWAPLPRPGAVLVLDEHDERLQQEQAPTWHGRDVAIERARRSGAPCVLVSPCPSLEALAWAERVGARVRVPPRADERAGWAVVDVVDRRRDDPRAGLWSDRLVQLLRDLDRGRVVCVLNRTGRSRLLACAACGELVRCERPGCGGALVQPVRGVLRCQRCGTERPVVCSACGATRLRNLRLGVSRAREELAALVREPVGEVTAARGKGDRGPPQERILVGTEAVLHRIGARGIGVVAFLDLDQELLAPRYRAAEQALALVAQGARLLGGRDGGGRLLLQTRLPRHPVVQAALQADPSLVADDERARRAASGFPPFRALAAVSGAAADEYVTGLRVHPGLEVLGPDDGRYLVRADDHGVLCDGLAAVARPAGRLRVEVDPQRV